MEKYDWKTELNEFDWSLCKMVANVTGKECYPLFGGDHYFIIANYYDNPDPDFVSALYDAICGRMGKRLREITDDPELRHIVARIDFAEGPKNQMRIQQPDPDTGKPYCHTLSQIMAVQVQRDNAEELMRFCGGGDFRHNEKGEAWFYFLNGSVFADAVEGEYIYRNSKGHFFVVSEEEFEREYEAQ